MSTPMLPHIREIAREEKDWRDDPHVLKHFPPVSPKVLPLGARVLCQLLMERTRSDSGLVLVQETRETEKWKNQVARVIALGPIAFCNRETGQPWREGVWVQPGDFVIIPQYGGQRRDVTGPDGQVVAFVTVNDHEVIERVFGNPLDLRSW